MEQEVAVGWRAADDTFSFSVKWPTPLTSLMLLYSLFALGLNPKYCQIGTFSFRFTYKGTAIVLSGTPATFLCNFAAGPSAAHSRHLHVLLLLIFHDVVLKACLFFLFFLLVQALSSQPWTFRIHFQFDD